jgi:hypothetical protein
MAHWILSHWMLVTLVLSLTLFVAALAWSSTRGLILWFVFGHGLGPLSKDGDVPSGIAYVISILGIVLGGTISFGLAIHRTGQQEQGYILLYFLAGLVALGPLTSILRSSEKPAREVWRLAYSGTIPKLTHAYDHDTLSFAFIALLTCGLLLIGCCAMAAIGWFPGQQASLVELFVNRVEVGECSDGTNKIHGLVIEVPINARVYRNDDARVLHCYVTLVGRLAEKWRILPTFDLDQWDAAAQTFQDTANGAVLCDTKAPHVQAVKVQPLGLDDIYHLKVYIVPKDKMADAAKKKETFADARNFILRDGLLTIKEIRTD